MTYIKPCEYKKQANLIKTQAYINTSLYPVLQHTYKYTHKNTI